MIATGFLEQKPRSPTGFGLVLLLHGAAIGGVLMIKGPDIIAKRGAIDIIDIRAPTPPPPPDPVREPRREETRLPAPSTPHVPDPEVAPPNPGPTFASGPRTETWDPRPATTDTGTGGGGTAVVPPLDPPRPQPVRTEALFSRGIDQQPPYPVAELRAEREGQVEVRVGIGADGRVTSVTRLSATSDAFWRATERHALSRWRFRPATEDGRPVASAKRLTVHFRLDGS